MKKSDFGARHEKKHRMDFCRHNFILRLQHHIGWQNNPHYLSSADTAMGETDN
jgi:hypothetical protein